MAAFKHCKHCGHSKPSEDFYKGRPECKACTAARRKAWYAENREREIDRVKRWQREHRDEYLAKMRRWKRANKDRERDGYLRRAFGITQEHFDGLMLAQRGVCAICRQPPKEG